MTLTVAVEDDAEEIDLVLSHTRHEDRLADPRDIPQENLVSGGDRTRIPLTAAVPRQMEGVLAFT